MRDRTLLNVLVKRDGMSVTGAARLLGMAPSWGVKWPQPVPEGGHCRPADPYPLRPPTEDLRRDPEGR